MTLDARTGDQANELQLAFADDVAFRRWYDGSLPRVYAYLLSRTGIDSGLAEELTQQTFVTAIESRHRFDGRADSVTWLCSIARHKLADHFRRLEREGRRQMRLEVTETTTEDPVGPWVSLDRRTEIDRVLATLPTSQRAAVIFSDLDGLSVPEVARLLGRTAGATQSLITRGRTSFRQRYQAGDDR